VDLGPLSDVSADDAVIAAEAARDRARRGLDPRGRQARPDTLRELLAAYEEVHLSLTPSGWKKANLARHVWKPLLGARLAEIEEIDLARVLTRHRQTAPHSAHTGQAVIRAASRWAVRMGLAERAFTAGDRHEPEPRDEFLLREEARTFVHALWQADDLDALAYLFILSTGARLSEGFAAAHAEIDSANAAWTLRRRRTKQRQAQFFPLSRFSLRVVERATEITGRRAGLIFSTSTTRPACRPDRTRGRLMARLGLPGGFKATDLRSTFTTLNQQAGANPALVDALLGHKVVAGPSRSARHYALADSIDAKRAVVESWGDTLQAWADGVDAAAPSRPHDHTRKDE
jgi:hypothetical protein